MLENMFDNRLVMFYEMQKINERIEWRGVIEITLLL